MPGCRFSLHLGVKKIDTVKNFDTLAEFQAYIQVHTFTFTMSALLSKQRYRAMKQSIVVRIDRHYGRLLYYPVNEAGVIFAAISGHTTLTPYTIAQAKLLGYTVREAQPDRLAGLA